MLNSVAHVNTSRHSCVDNSSLKFTNALKRDFVGSRERLKCLATSSDTPYCYSLDIELIDA